ncbi:MAG: alpha/beta hydrolase [Deltaproteobacteria bacterium]|nr:alpha/beta hydrolase [Deltaproteobacteria bacterium]
MSSTRKSQVRSRVQGTLRRRVRKLLVRNGLTALGTAMRINPLARPSKHGIAVERNIAYRPQSGPAGMLDVFRPTRATGPVPVVFYVHGGGFSMLSKDTHWGMAMTFARKGFLVFNINYRLAPKHPFPRPFEDVCAAFHWMVDHAEQYGGDLSRLIFAGESAGANLVSALTAACTFERPEPYARAVFERAVVPQAVVPACGLFQVSDIERFWRRKPMPGWIQAMMTEISVGYLGKVGVQPSADNELADPLRVYESDAEPVRTLPKFFLPMGTRDPLLDDQRRLEAALQKRGVEVIARYYPGEIHAFHAFIWREQARECWEEKFAFLESVIAAEQAASAA